MKVEDAIKSLSSPGDLAAFFLGYGLGFVVDAWAVFGGIPVVAPLEAGVLGATVCLGLKQAGQALFGESIQRMNLRRRLREQLSDDYIKLSDDLSRRVEMMVKDPHVSLALMVDLVHEIELSKYSLRALPAAG